MILGMRLFNDDNKFVAEYFVNNGVGVEGCPFVANPDPRFEDITGEGASGFYKTAPSDLVAFNEEQLKSHVRNVRASRGISFEDVAARYTCVNDDAREYYP